MKKREHAKLSISLKIVDPDGNVRFELKELEIHDTPLVIGLMGDELAHYLQDLTRKNSARVMKEEGSEEAAQAFIAGVEAKKTSQEFINP